MPRSRRLIAAALLVGFSGVLGGCSNNNMTSFDPTDWLDFLDTKKPVQGERKPVFPEGVPGLEQGVPKELYKGAAEERAREDQQRAQQLAAGQDQTPKEKPRHKKPKQPAADTTDQSAASPDGDNPPPAPKPTKRAHRTAPAATQDQQAQTQSQQPQAQSQQPQAAAPAQSSFPAPLPSGSFSH